MKKSLFIAALAVVAMASCTKNELKVPSAGTGAEITFTTPVLAHHTKSTELDNDAVYPKTASFNVYAYYNSGDRFESSTASTYMDNVKVTYNSSINDDTSGSGAWAPEHNYYWPKQGVLTFYAYSPSELVGDKSATAADGIKVENHEVRMTLDEQQDFLYATRAEAKKATTVGTNATYDGVDIQFNHALAVVKFTAATKDVYSPTTTIKIKKIEIKDINDKGTFEQKAEASSAIWRDQTGSNDYVAYDNTFDLSTPLSTTPATVGETVIVLPQNFTASTQKLYIEYFIKTDADGSQALIQTAELDFYNATELADNNKWEIGKRYTYNIVIGLDEIYFAPSVTNWVDITVDNVNVK